MSVAIIATVLFGLASSHSVYKRSYPSPKGYTHGKSDEYYKSIRSMPADSLKDRFNEQYKIIMDTQKSKFY